MAALREKARNFRPFSVIGVSLAWAALAACTTGQVGGAGQPASGGGPPASSGGAGGTTVAGGGTTSSGGSGTTLAQCVQGASFASARLTLLSGDQYRNIVQDVFGVTFPVSVTITALPSTSGFYPYNEGAQ